MNITLFFQDLIKRGAKLWREGNQLRCQGSGQVVTPEVLEILKQHENEVLDLLHENTPKPEEYPLSSPQREIWFDQMLHPGTPLYNIGGYTEINGSINPALFKSAVNLVVQSHDALRTQLTSGSEEVPMQVFPGDLPITVPFYDFSPETNSQEFALDWMQKQFVQPFELEGKPLFRFALLKVNENCFDFWFVYHHLIIDGWGISLISKILGKIYSALREDQKPDLVLLSYCHFVENDRLYIESSRYDSHLKYWKEKYTTLPEALFTPRYSNQFVDQIPPSNCQTLWIPRYFYNRVHAFAKNTESTLFHVILGVLYVYFTRTTQREELTIGLPVLNRSNATFKETVGLFIGVTAARFQFGTKLSFSELLNAIGKSLKSDYRHQRLPISELNRALGIQETGRMQLFDIQLNYAKHDHDAEFGVSNAKTIALTNDNEQTPLSISIWEFHEYEDVQVDFVYNLAYFDTTEIEQIQSRFLHILEYVLDHVDESIRAIPLMNETEQQQLQALNQTVTAYPKDKTIADLFQEQAEKTPDNIAVVFLSTSSGQGEEQQLTYRQLNRKANQLAHYLLSLKSKTEDCPLISDNCFIGICVERSLDMIIGLLGILKAGGAYVPLDPDYPVSRLEFMLEDSSVSALLTQSQLQKRLPVTQKNGAKVICIDSEWEQIACCSGDDPVRQSGPDNLAYMIYTSGSTGKPKGVMVEHHALHNFLSYMQQKVGLTSADKLLALTTLSFDITALELYLPLITGSQTIIISREISIDGQKLAEKMAEYQITIMQATPATWKLLIQSGWHQLTPLTIICGGEALPNQLGQTLLKNSRQLWNVYGPTETTIWSSIHDVTQYPERPELIGQAIANTKIYILDMNHDPTPPGIPGELCISGAGLARSYFNRPELTAEKFFDVELFDQKQRIYRTGDLASCLPDGNLEYLGRLDNQVKLRGFRIELTEIEITLEQYEAVNEAVVVLYNKEDPRLVAYVTLTIPIDDVPDILRTWLKTRLPEYMLPVSFNVLDKLPLTHNGKIDRKTLPAPDFSIQAEQQVPRTETEHLLCSLWSQVLGAELVSINSHFFKAGGHSLLATQLVSRIRESFRIEMPLQVIFEQPLLMDQAKWLDKQQRGTELGPIIHLEKGKPLVLSFAQQRLWFLTQIEGQSRTYNMPGILHLKGQLNKVALQLALTTLTERHEILRTCFPVIDGNTTVQINDAYNPLSITDLSELSDTEKQNRIREGEFNHAQIQFNINTGPLLSLHLLKLDQQKHILLFNIHHIISDGWSIGVLIHEWSKLYNSYCSNLGVEDYVSLPIQYTDYAAWQRDWLQGQILEEQLVYWKDKLSDVLDLKLPTDYPRPSIMGYKGKHLHSTLDKETTQGLNRLNRQYGVTMFMTLFAAFNVLLSRYSDQTDLAVGSPIANRTHHQTENLIGLFVNTLVLRNHVNCDQTFSEFLKQVRKTAVEAYSNQDIPFEYLVEQINPSRRLSHSPLFQVMFVLQNMPEETLAFNGLKISLSESENRTAKFDLTLSIAKSGDLFVCDWEYNTDLFRSDTIIRITEHFRILLEGIINNPEQLISQLPLLTKADQQQLQVWNQTETDYPKDETIIDQFLEQVEKTPSNIAVTFSLTSSRQGEGERQPFAPAHGKQLTYRELNQKANQVAHYLLELKNETDNSLLITDNSLIGICMERSLDMVIGLLGILKAGCAYLPLDPDYPEQRLQFMLKKSLATVLLSQSHLQEKLVDSAAKLVCLDSEWEKINKYSQENPVKQSGPEDLAYVIYTSGSTGIPNGVMIGHEAIYQHINYSINRYQIESSDTVLQFASLNFDASIEQIFSAWCGGARLILLRSNLLQTEDVQDIIYQEQITVINLPPAYWQQLLQGVDLQKLESLRLLILGGEALNSQQAQQTRKLLPVHITILNAYGPTEATISAILFEITDQFQYNYNQKITPIGKPSANTKIYILDRNNNPTPPGVPGELCIAGARLAKGYLNQADLTTKKFIEVTLFGITKQVYKTGDLARWLPDGNIEYIGRIDHQVKLRGYRIELGEIETELIRHEAVNEAVVILSEVDDNKRLSAYLTLKNGDTDKTTLTAILINRLKVQLPEYMIPSSFTILKNLPLTPNGKIDRKSLPAPDAIILAKEYEAPRTDVEDLLVEVWQQVLNQHKIGIHDNFFESGGDSILSIQIVSRARTLELELHPRDIFQHQTIAELAQASRPARTYIAEQGFVSGDVPLTPIQQSFFKRQTDEPWHFNQSLLLTASADVSETALRQSLTAIIDNHDVFRLRYNLANGMWKQSHSEPDNVLPFHSEDLTDLTDTEQRQTLRKRADFWQTSLNLESGPLMRLVLFNTGKETHILWCIHHLIVDGVSWRILLDDFHKAYWQAVNNESIRLPQKTSSFKTWAEHLEAWKESDLLRSETEYWRKIYSTKPLPMDNAKADNLVCDTRHYKISFDEKTTQRLLSETPAAFHTKINDILLTALTLSLRKWTGESRHLIDVESHGRADIFPDLDLSRTVGWFTSIHCVSLGLRTGSDLNHAIKTIKEQLGEVPNQGIGYGVLRYLCQEGLPQGQILFNYLGQFDQDLHKNGWKYTIDESAQTNSLEGNREHLIEINGQIYNGCLSMIWSYSNKQYNTETIEQLANNFKHQLNNLVDHCEKHFGYTPSDFPLVNLNQKQLDKLAQNHGNNIDNIYPLSPMQRGMLFHSLYEPEKDIYLTQFQCSLNGLVNPETFRLAWNYLLARHVSLRTAFLSKEETPLQLVCRNAEVPWEDLDWRSKSSEEAERELGSLLSNEQKIGFDLSQAPLMRIQLIRETETEYRFVWHHHHLLMDGWCIPILFTELLETYNAYQRGERPNLPTVRPYENYIQWLLEQDLEEAKEYWQEELKGFKAPTSLGNARLSEAPGDCKNQYLTLSPELTQSIHSFSRCHHVTLNSLIQGAWASLLSRYSGENDIVFGVTSSGRQIPIVGIDRMVGLFINTLPLRVTIEDNTLIAALQQLQQRQQQNEQYAYATLADIQNWSEVPNGVALFDSIVVFENYPVDEKLIHGNRDSLHITDIQVIEYTNYPLTLTVTPGKQLYFKLSYNSHQYSQENIERILTHLNQLLEGFIAHPEYTLPEFSLHTEAEKERFIEWNKTETNYPKDKTLVDLFHSQVEKTPDATALVFPSTDFELGEQQLTYRELNQKANQVAHYLLNLTTDTDNSLLMTDNCLVGICVERSLEMVIGLLGILKAGCAYVPLDPEYPEQRLAFMIKDSGIQILISQNELKTKLLSIASQTLSIVSVETILNSETPIVNRKSLIVNPQHMAYVIYTSGSTGQPKGVIGTHQGMVNRLNWMWQTYPFAKGEVCCHRSSINFVDHIAELFSPLLQGVPLILISNEKARDTLGLMEILKQYKVTRLLLVPSLLKNILEQAENESHNITSIKYWVCSGETLPCQLVTLFYEKYPECYLLNIYGSSEVSADVVSYQLERQDLVTLLNYFLPEQKVPHFSLSDDLSQETVTTNGMEMDKLKQAFTSHHIPVFPQKEEEYYDYLKEYVLPYIVNTASPKFIGHMTSALPSFNYKLTDIISKTNQNMVKVETSKSLVFMERQAMAMLHHAFFDLPEPFYNKHTQQTGSSLGITVSGGSTANISALWVARNLALPPDETFSGVSQAGLNKALAHHNYDNIVLLGTRLMHYSMKKAASLLGMGRENIIFVDQDEKGKMDTDSLQLIIKECQRKKWCILAIVGIAGTTETGIIDPLDKIAHIATMSNIYFHVDAAWGGPVIFSNRHKSKLKGIEKVDSITLCGHKQLYLPMGISFCLFRQPDMANAISTSSPYQAREGSYDFGQFSPEGSRSSLSMCLHAAFHLIGKQGYAKLIDDGIEKAQYLRKQILKNKTLELIMEPELNIVNFRYIPKIYRESLADNTLTREDNARINEINIRLQEAQFLEGRTFLSRTQLSSTHYGKECPIDVNRAVLANPLTTNQDIDCVIDDLLTIAADLIENKHCNVHSQTGKNSSIIQTETSKPSFSERLKTLSEKKELLNKYTLPIGKPISNTKVYILNIYQKPVPIGMVGELYVGGVGIAHGYLNNPELTAEKFIKIDLFGESQRLYKTGDLARQLPDGNIEFLGRKDNQVKLRGFRIELGEIESVLNKYEIVRESVLVLHGENDNQQLVAYVILNTIADDVKNVLRSWLKSHLPEYMVPVIFVVLDKLPLTPNGKIDRKSLEQLAVTDNHLCKQDFIAPRTFEEKLLVDIWRRVLDIDKIGLNDNFFELGGHSLLATQLVSGIRETFSVELPLRDLFDSPSVSALLLRIEMLRREQPAKETTVSLSAIGPMPDERYQPFPLSDIQQAYWLGRSNMFELGNVATHGYAELLCRDLDLHRFNHALQKLIERHEMLRMVVLLNGEQRILENVPHYHINCLDLRGKSDAVIVTERKSIREQMSHQILPADIWPLFEIRATLQDERLTMLHISFDALIADAWSIQILEKEWLQLYHNPELQLTPLTLSFRDYILSEKTWQSTEWYQQSLSYWLNRLDTLPPAPELPLAQNPSAIAQPKFKRRNAQLDKEYWQQLKERATWAGLTPSGVLLAAFAGVLTLWSKHPRFTLNLTLFNRVPAHEEVNDIIGDFTSLILLAVDNSEQEPFVVRAKRLQKQLWSDLDNRYVSGVHVLRELAGRRGEHQSALMPVVFTSTLALDFEGEDADLDQFGEVVYHITQTPQVWLDHQVSEKRGALDFSWDAIEELFPDGMLDDLFNAYCLFIKKLAISDDAWQSDYNSLLPDSHLSLQRKTNTTNTSMPNELLHTAFMAQAQKTPDQHAVICSYRILTYGELSQLTNQVGRKLRQLGATPNTLIAVVMEKGWEQVAGVIGILLSGAAYLPIDPQWPLERRHYLLKHGEVKIVLTQSKYRVKEEWPATAEVLCIDNDDFSGISDHPLEIILKPTDLAYVIFTSGSTGQPKGVMIDHLGAMNTIVDINQRFKVVDQDRVLALSALSFDLSVYDIFGPLAVGATVIMPDINELREPEHWVQLMVRHRITIWNTVPALMRMLVDYIGMQSEIAPEGLRLVMMSGDWIPVDLPYQIKTLWRDSQVISLGGATEASIWSIYYPVEAINCQWKSIPYGKPLKNQTFHVFNELLAPCPTWVPGQLYIGGIGLAKGYWRDDERSRVSFIVHPETRERLYKTGDLGRYLPDGNIEFLGREDFQVKIRGYRIELGEIETALLSHPLIKEAIVTVKGETRDNGQLVAYIVPNLKNQDDYAPSESGETNDLIIDPVERMEFKLKQPGLRQSNAEDISVDLHKPVFNDFLTRTYLERQSYRQFSDLPISFGSFSLLLSSLFQMKLEDKPLAKYRYPSAGNLYPVQTYLSIKPDKVEGLNGGVYYYNPADHRLILLHEGEGIGKSAYGEYGGLNQQIFEQAAFGIFFVGQLDAITPLYGNHARDFCMLEAGYMSQLIMEIAPKQEIGLCPIGTMDFEDFKALFNLDAGHIFLHSFLGGKIVQEQKQQWLESPTQSVSDKDVLVHYLEQKLPEYMIPGHYIRLENIPLSANGKVDRNALPEPDAVVSISKKDYVAPRTQSEKSLATIWSEIMKKEPDGIHEDFFEAGGDSLLATRFITKIRNELQINLPLFDLFERPTIAQLAEHIDLLYKANRMQDDRASDTLGDDDVEEAI